MHIASKNVERISKVILGYLLVKYGINGVIIVPAKEYVLIIQPKISSFNSPFFPNKGNRGAAKE